MTGRAKYFPEFLQRNIILPTLPAITDPTIADPAVTDPAIADPVVTDPAIAKSGAA
jgi:hypothetical protein